MVELPPAPSPPPLTTLPHLLWAFLVRDFHTQTSYRAAFVLSFVGLFFRAFIFFFISRFIGDMATQGLTEAGYTGDYFAFVLIGLAFNLYVGLGLTTFADSLREAQTTGTLEAMMMTPTPVSLMVVGAAGWSYAFTTLRVLVYLGLGAILGIDLSGANWGLAAVALLLALIAFASIGIIAASVIMVIKRGDPITALVANISALVGGVYYPIEVLPGWLQTIAQFIPLTHALRLMRLTLLNGAGWAEVRGDMAALSAFCVVLLPLSLFTFRTAVNKARRDGSLAQY
jgi:ABC-2 type transport system permease protein